MDGVMIMGDYFVEATEMSEFSGLPLTTNWILVNAQIISCRAGTFVNNRTFVCDDCPPPYTSGSGDNECSQCLER